MSQSTPINMLRRGVQQQPQDNQFIGGNNSDSQLVEDILKEMGESPGIEQQTNINSQSLQYVMDSSQVPPNHNMNPEQSYQQSNKNYYNKDNIERSYNDSNNSGNNSIFESLGFNLQGETLRDKLMKNIKYPVLVFIIIFIISLPEINRVLFGFFPKLLLESGQVSIAGIMIKSLLGMILFTGVAIFI